MKKYLLLVAGGISLLFGIGILSSGVRQHQAFVSSDQNPFEDLLFTENTLKQDSQQQKKVFVRQDGTFGVLFGKSELSFWSGKIRLESGEAFLSGHFFLPEHFSLNADQAAPSFPYTTTTAGEVLIGPLLVRFGGGDVLLERHTDPGLSRIYAATQEVDLFFEGRAEPFVVPPGMWVTIPDGKVNAISKQLYYSKLRKKTEFRLAALPESVNPEFVQPSFDYPEGKILWAQGRRSSFSKKLHQFSQDLLAYWYVAPHASIKKSVTSLQQTFDFWTLPRRAEKAFIQSQGTDLFASLSSIKEQDWSKAKSSLKRFALSSKDADWQTFLSQKSPLSQKWMTFLRSSVVDQKALLAHPEGQELYQVWYGSDDTSWAKFKRQFFVAQHLLGAQDQAKALSFLSPLPDRIESLIPGTIDPQEIARYRRISSALIEHQPAFETSLPLFRLWKVLSAKEIAAYRTASNQQDEAQLEIAQDTLRLLRRFIESDSPNASILTHLEQQFKSLDLEEVRTRLGRSEIFSPRDLETMQFITFVGEGGLTPEKITELKKQHAYFNDFSDQWSDQPSLAATPSEPFLSSGDIQTASQLEDWFIGENIDISQITWEETDGMLRFENVYFKNKLAEGSFVTQTQLFTDVSVAGVSFERLSLDHFAKAVMTVDPRGINTISVRETVPQSTTRARFERLLLRRSLQNVGFSLSLDGIIALDEDLDHFLVQKAVLDNLYEVRLEYRKSAQTVEQIHIEHQGSTYTVSESIPLKSLVETVRGFGKPLTDG